MLGVIELRIKRRKGSCFFLDVQTILQKKRKKFGYVKKKQYLCTRFSLKMILIT